MATPTTATLTITRQDERCVCEQVCAIGNVTFHHKNLRHHPPSISLMLDAFSVFVFTLMLVIWRPKGLCGAGCDDAYVLAALFYLGMVVVQVLAGRVERSLGRSVRG